MIGVSEGKSLYPFINKFLYCSWVMLFISIGLGMLYQAIATCYIGTHLVNKTAFACSFPAQTTFQLFTASFLLGIGLFIVGAILAIRRSSSETT